MTNVFVDADIVMDLLTKREGFFEYAAEVFTFGDKELAFINVSSLTIANVYYLLSRQYDSRKAWQIVQEFRIMVHVKSVDSKIIDLALSSNFKDFEDAIQYFTAIENGCELLLTRNLKDYKEAQIPIMTAESYIHLFES